jgi:RNA polymerase sigma-70 factor (ECF subfamily)
MSGLTDLIERAKAGEPTAFGDLVCRYRGLVFTVCFEHTGNFADSEELTQEVFLAAYRNLSSLREPQKFAGWLHGIARNICRMHRRQSRPDEMTLTDGQECALDRSTNTVRVLELQNVLHGALMRVTERSRQVLSLHYLGGYSYSEISALCNLPLRTVRSRLHEARSQLKSRLLEIVAELCQCSRDGDHTARCVLERCGAEPCACVTRLLAD